MNIGVYERIPFPERQPKDLVGMGLQPWHDRSAMWKTVVRHNVENEQFTTTEYCTMSSNQRAFTTQRRIPPHWSGRESLEL